MVEENQDGQVIDEPLEDAIEPNEETEETLESAEAEESAEAIEESETVEDDEVVVTIGEESPPQEEEAPEWVKELRKKHREDKKRIKELEAQLSSNTESQPVKLGEKPTLEAYDYDSERYEEALVDYMQRKREVEKAEEAKAAEVKAQQEAWNNTLNSYTEAKESLKVKDFDDAEEVVLENLSETQQGMILQGADNAALVVYALGKNPAKAKELASIKDPVKFAFAVGKLETTLKVNNRKAPPPPEKPLKGSGNSSGAVDSTLEKLRSEAEKTGDYSKVMAYKRSKKKG